MKIIICKSTINCVLLCGCKIWFSQWMMNINWGCNTKVHWRKYLDYSLFNYVISYESKGMLHSEDISENHDESWRSAEVIISEKVSCLLRRFNILTSIVSYLKRIDPLCLRHSLRSWKVLCSGRQKNIFMVGRNGTERNVFRQSNLTATE